MKASISSSSRRDYQKKHPDPYPGPGDCQENSTLQNTNPQGSVYTSPAPYSSVFLARDFVASAFIPRINSRNSSEEETRPYSSTTACPSSRDIHYSVLSAFPG